MITWLKRIALGAVVLVALLVVCGSIYEQLARRSAERDFPPPGRLVDIGGRHLQLDCRGHGAPTVVFESGLDALGSLSWAFVHKSIGGITRACAYSRAGLMWSDGANRSFSALNAAEDLHAALARAGERPPYVMVGHSMGGPYVVAFTSRYGGDVAGLVFIDASHPDQVARLNKAAGKALDPVGQIRLGAALAWTGLTRLITAYSPAGPPGAPTTIAPPAHAYLPQSLSAMLAESDAVGATLATAGANHRLGDRPLVVLTHDAAKSKDMLRTMGIDPAAAARVEAVWLALQNDEASWSSRSRHEVVKGASHYIQFDRPEAVVAAIREVVEDVRSEKK